MSSLPIALMCSQTKHIWPIGKQTQTKRLTLLYWLWCFSEYWKYFSVFTMEDETSKSENTSDCDTDSDESQTLQLTEPDPAKINFEFKKIGKISWVVSKELLWLNFVGKSTKEGVLVTHGSFKFTKNNWSRDGTTYWYRCSAKKATGCQATATVKRVEEEDENGSLVIRNFLVEVSTPEVW